jgi:sigma-E factor negative regulatory protein RseB
MISSGEMLKNSSPGIFQLTAARYTPARRAVAGGPAPSNAAGVFSAGRKRLIDQRFSCAMKRALALLALAIGCAQVRAEGTPAVLQRMLDAAGTLNYRGHVVQIEGNHTQSLRLLHRAGANGGDDRVHSLQGRYWELRRTGSVCRVALTDGKPARDEALVAAVFPSLLPQRLQRLAQYYDFEPIGSGRLADRAADFTVARPRDQFRFAYLLVTDAQTGLLLKVSLIDGRGRELRQAFFVDLELLPELPAADWEQPHPAASPQLVWSEYTLDRRGLGKDVPWRVSSLPPGFSLGDYARGRLPGGSQEVEQLTVSDGLATVSVFIDRASSGEQPLQGVSRIEALPAYGTTVGGHHVILLGAVPVATLEHIAKALTPVGTAATGGAAGAPAVPVQTP